MQTARSLFPLSLLALFLPSCGGTVTTATTCTSGCAPDASPTADASPSAGDASPSCNPPVPNSHEPEIIDCSTTRPPGYSNPSEPTPPDGGPPGTCTNDSQCTTGTNPRCTPVGKQAFGTECTSDACATDTDCGSGSICQCGGSIPNGGRSPNVCMPGNCQVDSDCGPGGYCSPTYDTQCGPYDGVVGFFCHRPADQCTKDECTNDSDCPVGDSGFGAGTTGYCAWDGTTAKWICAYAYCSG